MTYLEFYSAMSYESLARIMHKHAATKVSTLDLAKGYYIAALESLLSPNIYGADSGPSAVFGDAFLEDLALDQRQPVSHQCDGREDRPITSSSASYPRSESCETASLASSSTSSTWSSSFKAMSHSTGESFLSTKKFLPSDPTASLIQRKGVVPVLSLNPPVSSAIRPIVNDQSTRSSFALSASPTSTDVWLFLHSRTKYNANLTAFRDRVKQHIGIVESLKICAVKSQQEKRMSAAPASYWVLPSDKMSDDEKEQRIRQGRARGWQRKSRFGEEQAERIKLLCSQAIRELEDRDSWRGDCGGNMADEHVLAVGDGGPKCSRA